MFIFFLMIRRPPRSTLFPYTTLFRSPLGGFDGLLFQQHRSPTIGTVTALAGRPSHFPVSRLRLAFRLDRKSTRLNSSHANISYAVFCLKKKKINTNTRRSTRSLLTFS